MIWLSVLLLAIAVSFDSLAIGISYGLNGITVPPLSKAILSIVSGLALLLSMALRPILSQWLAPRASATLGGLLFVLLGLYNLWRSYQPNSPQVPEGEQTPILSSLIQVFQEPLKADRDQSQHITGLEAFVLGGVLSLDAIAAGLGAALLTLPLWPTTIAVMVASLLFISQGLKTGFQLRQAPGQQHDLRWVPGLTILILGFFKMFF